jgi:urea carboxylase
VPWLLRHFDRIRWHPVEAEELLDLRAAAKAGRLELEIEESTFRLADHNAFLGANADAIAAFEATRDAAYAEERAAWQRSGELTRDHGAHVAHAVHADDELADLPAGAVVVASPLAGAVAKVHCGPGDAVAADATVVTVEAMKMEHHVTAPDDAVVERVVIGDGELVQAGTPLVVLVPRP